MLKSRIIPCLLLQGEDLVKTINFTSPKYIGDPLNTIKIFNDKCADEIIILDINATKNSISPNFNLLKKIAVDCRMPVCYGGGVKTLTDALRIIELGFEKISINSAFLKKPELIQSIANEVGTQSVVVSIDVKKTRSGYFIYNHTEKIIEEIDLISHIKKAINFGAGELVINSVHMDGMMSGYDIDLAKMIRSEVNCPITLLGGAGSLGDMYDLIKECGVVGVAAGSFFVFKGINKSVLISYPNQELRDKLSMKAYI